MRVPFLIAEIAASHVGDVNTLDNLIKAAHDAGADAVQFQLYYVVDLMPYQQMRAEAVWIEPETWAQVVKSNRRYALDFWAKVYGSYDRAVLDLFDGLHYVRPNSYDVHNRQRLILDSNLMLEGTKLPDVVSVNTGQHRPTALHQAKLEKIKEFAHLDCVVSYADHMDSEDTDATIIVGTRAQDYGATAIERHIMLEGCTRDHYSAFLPETWKHWATTMRRVPWAK